MCRAQGVVAQAANDFAFSAIPPIALTGGLTCAAASLILAPHVKRAGTRRLALLGSVLYPGGMMALPAAAVAANSLPAYAAATGLMGGIGFWCIYPQIPPLLTTTWFSDRAGLASSLYFTAFGSGLLLGTPMMEACLSRFRVPPRRLGGLDELEQLGVSGVWTGPSGERLCDLGDGVGAQVVVLATDRDLATSGFAALEEGCYLLDAGCTNGVVQSMLVLASLNFVMLQLAAWSFRLPAKPTADNVTVGPDRAHGGDVDGSRRDAEGPTMAAGPDGDGVTLWEAQRSPHMPLLAASMLGLCVSGLPFLSVGKLIVQDVFAVPSLPSATITATVAGFPALVGASNMMGRLMWGPLSDRIGYGTALTLVGTNAACLLAMPHATSLLYSASGAADALVALRLFQAATAGNLVLMAGAPVLLAPAVTSLFGRRHAAAIYQRTGAVITVASVLGCTVVTSMRDRAYLREATRLADVCDEAAFVAAFGEANDPARLGALVDSNTITLPLLLRVAPAGTPDPTPLLYNDAFHALAASSMLATLCNIAVFMVLLPPRKALGRAQ